NPRKVNLPGVLASEAKPPTEEVLLLLGGGSGGSLALLLLLAFLLGALLRLLRLLGVGGGRLGGGRLVLGLGDGGNRRDQEREAQEDDAGELHWCLLEGD